MRAVSRLWSLACLSCFTKCVTPIPHAGINDAVHLTAQRMHGLES